VHAYADLLSNIDYLSISYLYMVFVVFFHQDDDDDEEEGDDGGESRPIV